jgi:hypothetical protein
MDDTDSGVETSPESVCDFIGKSGANIKTTKTVHGSIDEPIPVVGGLDDQALELGLKGLRA